MSAWIKCSDRLPGSGLVLAYSPQHHGVMGPISVQQAASILWWHMHYAGSQFTHWQPLPAEPISADSDTPTASQGAAISAPVGAQGE